MTSSKNLGGAEIQSIAAAGANSLAGVSQSQPFGPDYEVLDVSDKVSPYHVTLKRDPEHGIAPGCAFCP